MKAARKQDLALLAHLFRRAGFGATYDQLEAYAAGGYEAAVEELLHPETRPDLEDDLLMRLNMGWQTRPARELELTYWLYRMINTQRPLEEKLTLFWHGVLCTGYAKVNHPRQMGVTTEPGFPISNC